MQMSLLVCNPSLIVQNCLIDDNSIFAAKSADEPIWQAVLDVVKNVSEAMMSSLPSFWRISKDFMEGKFKKVIYNICGFGLCLNKTLNSLRPRRQEADEALLNVELWH